MLVLLSEAMLLVSSVVVEAQFIFTTNNGSITITGYSGPGGNIVIPSTINGYPVANIAAFAFSAYSTGDTITGVIVPDSVTNIGRDAFEGCLSLTNAIISTNVTEINNEVFNSTGLTSFAFPVGITSIDPSAFDSCSQLANVTIPATVVNIGQYAFNDCYTMTSVVIPDSVTNLGDWAFEGCVNVTNLTIGRGISTIPTYEFEYCTDLQSVTIPDEVTNIGSCAFAYCFALTNITYGSGIGTNLGNLRFNGTINLCTITISSNNPVMSSLDGVMFDKTRTTLIQCPIAKAGGYTIPNTVTGIWNEAFLNCSLLSNITLDSSITSNGGNIFSGCIGITNFSILEGVTNILPTLFYPCLNLESFCVSAGNLFYSSLGGVLFDKNQITLIQYPYNGAYSYVVPKRTVAIADLAFANCLNLTNITLPNTITSIGYAAFASCSALTSIVIPDGVSNINSATFINCYNLATAHIPASVTNVGSYAFGRCISLTSIYFGGNAPQVDLTAFLYFPLDQFNPPYIPATVYFLAETSGWSNSIAGIPTMLWLPTIQMVFNDAINSNVPALKVDWANGQTVVVDACTNLANPVWQPIETNILSSGASYFSDPQWTNYASRFYRLRTP